MLIRPVFFASVLATSIVSAARAAEPAAAPADDVSTLNGQLVPVGEQHLYRYSYKPWNVSTNPVMAVVGMYSLSGSYAFHSNFALRVDGSVYNQPMGIDADGFEVNLSVPIYLRKVSSGAFFEPGFMYRHMSDDGGDDGVEQAVTTLGPQVLAGWHWSWDSGFNVALAFGLGRNLKSDAENSKLFANGYLRVGYAF